MSNETKKSGYRIEILNNCTLVFGKISIQDMIDMTTSAPAGALMDLHMASLTGAALVFGMPDDLKTLKQREDLPRSQDRVNDVSQAHQAGNLPETFCDWLADGDRGMSSDYLAHCITGLPKNAAFAYPHDNGDLKRCLVMINTLTDRSEASILDRMSEAPAPWPTLIADWITLKRLSAESSSALYDRLKDVLQEHH